MKVNINKIKVGDYVVSKLTCYRRVFLSNGTSYICLCKEKKYKVKDIFNEYGVVAFDEIGRDLLLLRTKIELYKFKLL